MLMAVVASGVFVRMSPIPLPLPLVQIALGALIAYATGFHVERDPDIFFLLFLPPLLFLPYGADCTICIAQSTNEGNPSVLCCVPIAEWRPRRNSFERRWPQTARCHEK